MPIEFPGLLLAFQHRHLLIYGTGFAQFAPAVVGPPVWLRPGYHFFYEPDYVLPDAIIDDRGHRLNAPDCYEWLELHGDLYPRADILGQRPAGTPHTSFLKEIDLTDMAVFAGSAAAGPGYQRIDLAVELSHPPAPSPMGPATFPVSVLDRGLLCYYLDPRQATLEQLLAAAHV